MSDTTGAEQNTLEIQLGNQIGKELNTTDRGSITTLIVHIPLRYIGSSNSYVDVCQDIVDTSWTVETLAALAGTFGIENEERSTRLTLHEPHVALWDALLDCSAYYLQDQEDGSLDRLDEICSRVNEHEEALSRAQLLVPQLGDWYFANLMAANHEWRSESPEYFWRQIAEFPERQVEFYRSGFSSALGETCYTSRSTWLLPRPVALDTFFALTEQKYREKDFAPAAIVVADGAMFAVRETVVAQIPLTQYARSRACAGLAEALEDDGPMDWIDVAFAQLPLAGVLRPDDDGGLDLRDRAPRCLMDSTGSLILIDDGGWRHLLYEVQPLPLPAVQALAAHSSIVTEILGGACGQSPGQKCNWAILSDEEFELLCYDVICTHPRFDAESVRKLGKSRSRDGGRDIEALEVRRFAHEPPRKWIFQCKLVKSDASLGASKVSDIGDTIERYGASGYGVLTSTLIDATLYDKIDDICGRRRIKQENMSVLELERALARQPAIKKKYFPPTRK